MQKKKKYLIKYRTKNKQINRRKNICWKKKKKQHRKTNSIQIEIPYPGQSRLQPYFIITLNKSVKCQH